VTPSAPSFASSMSTRSVGVSSSPLGRTAASSGSAWAAASSASRRALNSSWLMPLLLSSSSVNPLDWPRPRTGGGVRAKTFASRTRESAAVARWVMAISPFSSPGRSSQGASDMKPRPEFCPEPPKPKPVTVNSVSMFFASGPRK
jgi:hypothetical protein